MSSPWQSDETIGLIRPAVDAHTLGITSIAGLVRRAGFKAIIADRKACEAANQPEKAENLAALVEWIRSNGITRLGLSYRLDPVDGARFFLKFFRLWKSKDGLFPEFRSLRALYFAGLPETCSRVADLSQGEVATFHEPEPSEKTLLRLGIPQEGRPLISDQESEYDQFRRTFSEELIQSESYEAIGAAPRLPYPEFGTSKDHLNLRVDAARRVGGLPLLRVHAGPYQENREAAVETFCDWARTLAKGGFLDILSIGTSQRTQDAFEKDWEGLPNGGGVPVHNRQEYERIREAAHPMLVRTYAGSQNIRKLARVHEESLNIAWHALSFWWFSQIDGRGPLSVSDNLKEHLATLDVIAAAGKPFEPNVPHHFAFRGADDVTYILAGYLAARAAKARGIRTLVLQIMLNTPRGTGGLQDLAKARVLLEWVRKLEGPQFRVLLQPRAGLDYFFPHEAIAKAQLASVTTLMDDIEPGRLDSPDLIHVVSYSEAYSLADPPVIESSLKITRAALAAYRQARARGEMPAFWQCSEVLERQRFLSAEVGQLVGEIEREFPDPSTATALYEMFTRGYLPVPDLWDCRDQFPRAVNWQTRLVEGGIELFDMSGDPVNAARRIQLCREENFCGAGQSSR